MSVFSNRAQDAPGERAAYAGAILALLGERDPFAVLRATPAGLASAIADLSPTQVRTPESPASGRSARCCSTSPTPILVWGWRLRLILSHDRPQITGYDQDLWAERLHYADADPGQALELFGVLRAANLRLLERATPQDMARVGVHTERGEESIGYLCRLYAGHDLLHLNQIARIKASLA